MSRTETIEYFSRQLQEGLGPSLARLILYGSAASGEAEEGSDIDIAAIHFGSSREVLDRVAELSFEVALRYGEIIRGKARYDPKALLTREDAETVLGLVETLASRLSRELAS